MKNYPTKTTDAVTAAIYACALVSHVKMNGTPICYEDLTARAVALGASKAFAPHAYGALLDTIYFGLADLADPKVPPLTLAVVRKAHILDPKAPAYNEEGFTVDNLAGLSPADLDALRAAVLSFDWGVVMSKVIDKATYATVAAKTKKVRSYRVTDAQHAMIQNLLKTGDLTA